MKRILYLLGGGILLLLGLIGLALPVIPQVPFLVLGVFLLCRGSETIRQKILSHPLYKEKIRPVVIKTPILSGLVKEFEADSGSGQKQSIAKHQSTDQQQSTEKQQSAGKETTSPDKEHVSDSKGDKSAKDNKKGGTDMLEIGTKAPEFTLPDQNGEMRSLSDYRGQKVILYFYPKDMTAGCTKQACSFGELYPQFREKGAVVLGISKDSVASHKKFEEKYGLPFILLSDPEKEVIQAYGAWREKKNYGKVSMGVVRSTYLIDENGIIVKAFDKVKAADNPAQMLGELG